MKKTHKNIGPSLRFNKKWFEKHQKTLLWLLNTPVVRLWFRRVMRIERGQEICEIQPNCTTVFKGMRGDEYEYQTDFRTHWKYSKRIYRAFRPIWWLAHAWDAIVANPLKPSWNVGFDTLTVYPDPNPETSTVDGYVQRAGVDETWATIIAGAGTSQSSSLVNNYWCYITATATTDQYSQVLRGMALFDTSSLTAAADISAATVSIYWVSTQDDFGSGGLTWVSSNPATNTNIATADYGTFGSTAFANTIASGDFSNSAYNNWTLNASGIAAISKTGISKFGTKEANHDLAASAPTWGSGDQIIYIGKSADVAGTTQDPKLVVTYTLKSGGEKVKKLQVGLSISI
jgi:hypothetical protein